MLKLVDLKKAFDTVDYKILLKKLCCGVMVSKTKLFTVVNFMIFSPIWSKTKFCLYIFNKKVLSDILW